MEAANYNEDKLFIETAENDFFNGEGEVTKLKARVKAIDEWAHKNAYDREDIEKIITFLNDIWTGENEAGEKGEINQYVTTTINNKLKDYYTKSGANAAIANAIEESKTELNGNISDEIEKALGRNSNMQNQELYVQQYKLKEGSNNEYEYGWTMLSRLAQAEKYCAIPKPTPEQATSAFSNYILPNSRGDWVDLSGVVGYKAPLVVKVVSDRTGSWTNNLYAVSINAQNEIENAVKLNLKSSGVNMIKGVVIITNNQSHAVKVNCNIFTPKDNIADGFNSEALLAKDVLIKPEEKVKYYFCSKDDDSLSECYELTGYTVSGKKVIRGSKEVGTLVGEGIVNFNTASEGFTPVQSDNVDAVLHEKIRIQKADGSAAHAIKYTDDEDKKLMYVAQVTDNFGHVATDLIEPNGVIHA